MSLLVESLLLQAAMLVRHEGLDFRREPSIRTRAETATIFADRRVADSRRDRRLRNPV